MIEFPIASDELAFKYHRRISTGLGLLKLITKGPPQPMTQADTENNGRSGGRIRDAKQEPAFVRTSHWRSTGDYIFPGKIGIFRGAMGKN